MVNISWTATGKRIKKLMRDAGVTRSEMAERAGCCEETVKKWTNGWSRMSVKKLATVAYILGCGLDDIVCYGKGAGKNGAD